MATSQKCELRDWAGNRPYPGRTFQTVQDAFDFLLEDQRARHPTASEEELNEILGEFHTHPLEEDD